MYGILYIKHCPQLKQRIRTYTGTRVHVMRQKPKNTKSKTQIVYKIEIQFCPSPPPGSGQSLASTWFNLRIHLTPIVHIHAAGPNRAGAKLGGL